MGIRTPVIRILGLCLAFVPGPASGQAPQVLAGAPPAGAFREEVLAELPRDSEVKLVVAGVHHVVWTEKLNGTYLVKLDGKPQGGSYDEVKYLSISSDESHLAFFGKREGKNWVLVLDGKEGSQDYSSGTSVGFQTGGSSYAYGACIEKSCHLYVDGRESGAEYQEISYPKYSPDGKQLAYIGKSGKLWTAVVDGKETGPKFHGFAGFGFSPGGARFYIAAASGFQWYYVVDGASGQEFQVLSRIAFTEDGLHYAYGGVRSDSGFRRKKVFATVVLDGQTAGTYEGKGMRGNWSLLGGSVEFLAPGIHSLNPDFHGISEPDLTSDGKLVYAIRRDKGDIAVLVGGEAGPGFEDILSPVAFTDDLKHFAFVAKQGNDFVEVRDNVVVRTFAAGGRGPTLAPRIYLSKDGAHLAFETAEGGDNFKAGKTLRAIRSLVVDGHESPRYDALGVTGFNLSKDGSRYYCVVKGAKGDRDLASVNGQESKLYDLVTGARFTEDEKSVVFIARDGLRMLRVGYDFP